MQEVLRHQRCMRRSRSWPSLPVATYSWPLPYDLVRDACLDRRGHARSCPATGAVDHPTRDCCCDRRRGRYWHRFGWGVRFRVAANVLQMPGCAASALKNEMLTKHAAFRSSSVFTPIEKPLTRFDTNRAPRRRDYFLLLRFSSGVPSSHTRA